MAARVLPTRMNLLRQRRRLAVARRGHKLMKDKLEGLIRQFIGVLEQYAAQHELVDQRLPATLGYFMLADGTSGRASVAEALRECGVRYSIAIEPKRLLSVVYPEISMGDFDFDAAYSALTTTTDFDRACEQFRGLFPHLLTLASAEEKLIRMAEEIERSRRRVNALEHVVIPGVEQTIEEIAAKLEEADRANRARLMKVKSLLAAKDQAGT